MVCKDIKKKLNSLKIPYVERYDLSKKTYFQTGGHADIAIFPNNLQGFKDLVAYFHNSNIQYSIFGATTNCIFKDDTNLKVAIFSTRMKSMHVGNDIYVESGVRLPKMCNKLAKQSVSGFEELQGVPATIGGAIYMNAGCYGNEISRHLISVSIITKDGEIKEFNKSDCVFGYRFSIFHRLDCVILSAKFNRNSGAKDELFKRISFFHNHRHSTLEYRYRNVGSVFVTHDIYYDLAKTNIFYKFLLLLTRNIVHKAFRIKTNKLLNLITFYFFGLEMYTKTVSIMTMNVVINNGHGTKIIESYIRKVKLLTNNRVEIELI